LRKIKQEKYKQGIKNGTRKQNPGAGRKGELYSIELKLFFILTYFKCYPTFDLIGMLFDIDRSNAKHNVDNLTPVLEKVLKKQCHCLKEKIHFKKIL
jgi:hypothetical protein